MWNQVLRRVVHAEERRQSERRRQQVAQAASAAALASVDTVPASEEPPQASQPPVKGEEQQGTSALTAPANDTAAAPTAIEEAPLIEADDEDDYFVQKHLLSRPTVTWRCLEDSQQANCLALSPSRTLLAVGERDGRVSIWDNVTVRVITRELDPTLIALPASAAAESSTGEEKEQVTKATKSKPVPHDLEDGSGSAENDDASVEADDDDEDATEDAASVEEDGDVATEEDDEAEEDEEDDANGQEDEGETKTEEDGDVTAGGGVVLSLSDLRVVKSSLKVVTQCAWSCDARWLFAGCEEKTTRRARLCVWDVEAARLVSAFCFDAAITSLSPHPHDPKLLLVSYCNSRPVLLDVRSGDRTPLLNVSLENTRFTQPTPPTNSRHPSLLCCARYGRSGNRIYCATSRSTLAILDAVTLECVGSAELTVLVQFVDLSVDLRETALLVTSSKGIHEFSMDPAVGKSLSEVALHSTGAVRAPWAVCGFSGDEDFVVGTPVVRHRHVGENGLYTWPRGSVLGKTTAQHNVGVKDGVLALAWDRKRESVLAVSTTGALYVLEETFTTTWPGPMYPAGFRLITDNERHVTAFDVDKEEHKREKEKLTEAARHSPIDVFTVQPPEVEFPDECKQLDEPHQPDELRYLPAIPIAHYHRRHLQPFQGPAYHEDKHFGLGQSVFEPLKGALGKPKGASSSKKGKSRSKSGSSRSQKRRRW